MKKSTVLAVLFGITGILNAQDAVTHQFDSFKGKCTAATLDGSKVFETQAPAIVTAQKCVEVNPAKTYILSGEFKAAGQGTGLYFGIISYDEDMQEIKAQNINAFENTLTELSEPAKAGSRTIKVRSAANWKAVPANFSRHSTPMRISKTCRISISCPSRQSMKTRSHWELRFPRRIRQGQKSGCIARVLAGPTAPRQISRCPSNGQRSREKSKVPASTGKAANSMTGSVRGPALWFRLSRSATQEKSRSKYFSAI